jgi:hypothetical protein
MQDPGILRACDAGSTVYYNCFTSTSNTPVLFQNVSLSSSRSSWLVQGIWNSTPRDEIRMQTSQVFEYT